MLYNYYWAWAIENTRCCTYTMYWTNQPNPDQKSSQHEELNNKKTWTRDITFCCCSSVDDLQFLRFDELSMLLVIYPFGVVIMYPFVDLPHLKSLFSRFHWLRYELFWWHTNFIFHKLQTPLRALLFSSSHWFKHSIDPCTPDLHSRTQLTNFLL